jgi:hypothetical protein
MRFVNCRIVLQLLLIQIILFSQVLSAQDYLFKVIAASGKCTVLKNGKTDKLRAGIKLMQGDVVKLNDGDYAGLVSNKGRSLELKKPGTYNAGELEKMIAPGKGNIQKFTEYVLTASVNKKSSDNMKTLGAVVRGKAEQLETHFPKFTCLINNSITAKWFSENPNSIYLFKIVNGQDIAVFMKEVKDTSFTVELSGLGLQPDAKYAWVVESLSKQASVSDSNYFTLYADGKISLIKDSLNELQKGMDQNSAVDRMAKIVFLQDNNLNYDILNEYEEILKLAPGVDEYTDSYTAFLLENGMTKRAESILKNSK